MSNNQEFKETPDPLINQRPINSQNKLKSQTPPSKVSVEPILKNKTKEFTNLFNDIIFKTFEEHAFLKIPSKILIKMNGKIMKSKAKKWTEEIMNNSTIAPLFTIKPTK